MKKTMCVLLLLGTILFLSACEFAQKDSVAFYYPRAAFHYGTGDTVMAAETRDLSDHADDFVYMVRIYLMGPTNDETENFFPKSTRLLSCEVADGAALIALSDSGTAMSDIRFTLACACLARTCIENSTVSQITIVRGSQSLTLNQQSLLLSDDSITKGESNT